MSTALKRETDLIGFVKGLSGAFEAEITPVRSDTPAGTLKVRLALPSRNFFHQEETGSQVDYVYLDERWSDQACAQEIRNRLMAMITHEFDEWFVDGNGKQLFAPSHDVADIGTARHWFQNPNSCAKADVAL